MTSKLRETTLLACDVIFRSCHYDVLCPVGIELSEDGTSGRYIIMVNIPKGLVGILKWEHDSAITF